MEAVRDPLRTATIFGSSLVRVIEITEIGLRDGTEGAIVVTDPALPNTRTVRGSILRGIADEQLLATDPTRRTPLTVIVTLPQATEVGLVCGGRARLLVTPLGDVPTEALQWFDQSAPVVLIAATDGSGSDMAVGLQGSVGSVGPHHEAEAIARQILRRGFSGAQVHVLEGREFVFNAALPVTNALIVGDGPMAAAVKAQGELMGWKVELTEDLKAATEFCQRATAADAVIVISHDRALDVPVLAAALDGPAGYIGAMGSRSTQAIRAAALDAIGHANHDRIHGPVGLDLGSRTPAETAVAIAAEFLAVRRGAPPASLSAHTGPIHG
ncbi:MAG: hypothetical protein HKN03_16675 [Acidimicrobiales bacterium]|nr:hypothetical protein [Acidimicrobiales bacterium]